MVNFLYVDNSNIWIEGMRVAAYQNGLAPEVWSAVKNRITDPTWKLDFDKLFEFAGGGKGEVPKYRAVSSLHVLLLLFLVAIAQIAAAAATTLTVKIGAPAALPPVSREHAQRLAQALKRLGEENQRTVGHVDEGVSCGHRLRLRIELRHALKERATFNRASG